MAEQVAGKEVTRLNLMILQIRSQLVTRIARILPHGDEESEPAGLRVLLRFWQQKSLDALQTLIHGIEVLAATLHDEVEFLQLGAADSRLEVCSLEVIA